MPGLINMLICCLQLKYWDEGPGKDEGICEGDVLVTNHPQLAGGSHLPDITVVTPVFRDGAIVFYVASRGERTRSVERQVSSGLGQG